MAAGLVVLCPLLGGPRATQHRYQVLMDLSTLAAVLVVAAWMLSQYALQVRFSSTMWSECVLVTCCRDPQIKCLASYNYERAADEQLIHQAVPLLTHGGVKCSSRSNTVLSNDCQVAWVCDLLGPPKSLPRRLALYLGLVPVGSGITLEALLRFKCLALVAIILKWRSLRWAPYVIASKHPHHLPLLAVKPAHTALCSFPWRMLVAIAGISDYALPNRCSAHAVMGPVYPYPNPAPQVARPPARAGAPGGCPERAVLPVLDAGRCRLCGGAAGAQPVAAPAQLCAWALRPPRPQGAAGSPLV